MTNDELRAQDALAERVNAALSDGTGEVLIWHPDRPSGHVASEENEQ